MQAWTVEVGCAHGLESIVEAETRSILATCRRADSPESAAEDAIALRVKPGRIGVEATLSEAYALNLLLATAERVCLQIDDFRVRHLAEFSRFLKKASLESWFCTRPTIRVRSKRSKLYHTGALADRLHAALERIGEAEAVQPSGDGVSAAEGDPPPALLEAEIVDDRCRLYVDLSGQPLHRRGYRLAQTKAPLREDLAAALLAVSGWDGSAPLFDPFCGAGTIPIEAARRSTGVPPGWNRRFAFETLADFDARSWAEIRAVYAPKPGDVSRVSIYASDRDAGAISATLENAQRAGIQSQLQVEHAALSSASAWNSKEPLVVVTDPPHGRRLGKGKDLRPVYQRLGDRIQQSSAALTFLVGSAQQARLTALELRQVFNSRSGGAKVVAYVGR